MTDAEEFDHAEPGAIGVGMGGSCPVCRAPVDLGQEFCLECGSPIRFTPRQRKQQRSGSTGPRAGTVADRAAPPTAGFPWIPLLIVLALVGGGVVFALVEDGGTSKTSDSDKTEPALPTITNETQPETTSDTETTTVDDCSTAGVDGTQPAIGDAGTATPPLEDPKTAGSLDGSEQIPELSDGSAAEGGSAFDGQDVPSTDGSDSGAVTVDGNGNLCAGTATTDPTNPGATDPAIGSDPATTTPITPTTPVASGDWPAGKEGWTVIVAGYDTMQRATQRAADVQEDGFDDGGVLFSTDYPSLCPGIHVVFSGTFENEAGASKRLAELSDKDYAGMYVREIKTGGSTPSSCTAVRSQN